MGRQLVLIVFLAFPFTQLAADTTLRCASKVIQVGDSSERVRTHCGQPNSIERETMHFSDGGKLDDRCFFGTVTIERWQYDRGFGGIPATVMIVDGKVERIRLRTGGYESGLVSPCR